MAFAAEERRTPELEVKKLAERLSSFCNRHNIPKTDEEVQAVAQAGLGLRGQEGRFIKTVSIFLALKISTGEMNYSDLDRITSGMKPKVGEVVNAAVRANVTSNRTGGVLSPEGLAATQLIEGETRGRKPRMDQPIARLKKAEVKDPKEERKAVARRAEQVDEIHSAAKKEVDDITRKLGKWGLTLDEDTKALARGYAANEVGSTDKNQLRAAVADFLLDRNNFDLAKDISTGKIGTMQAAQILKDLRQIKTDAEEKQEFIARK